MRTGLDLWFRGESARHAKTSLVPKVYRPAQPVDELLETEYLIWQDFMRCGEQLCDVIPEDDFEWYFLMQHHGAPTRLLDWSDGALIALHFAVADFDEQERREQRIVYVLDPDWLSSETGEPPKPAAENKEYDVADLYVPHNGAASLSLGRIANGCGPSTTSPTAD